MNEKLAKADYLFKHMDRYKIHFTYDVEQLLHEIFDEYDLDEDKLDKLINLLEETCERHGKPSTTLH